MSNKITVAPHAGFCFGVTRATDALENRIREARRGEKIYTLGDIIHNDGYNATLAQKGVATIEEKDILRVCEEATEQSPAMVFIRAHGVTRQPEVRTSHVFKNNLCSG